MVISTTLTSIILLVLAFISFCGFETYGHLSIDTRKGELTIKRLKNYWKVKLVNSELEIVPGGFYENEETVLNTKVYQLQILTNNKRQVIYAGANKEKLEAIFSDIRNIKEKCITRNWS
ncbi:hypothetical protein LNTAR_06224 [Lentisphaera araneosa HTCC2155]|uniref:Uncharacterized protein n=1 Tax=Lentisphaera araneosa HTCC2155 TaxID=313628 RepID=A6DN71_9BACT|nr:hypothetical protein [Lentisphaera araneosa]EDM26819.1 hypothetical protein LNTAR_06224 [Lentisphaera araneosa HTCC2155]